MTTPTIPYLVEAKDVAKALKLSLVMVRLLTRQGKLHCVRIGRRVLYRPEHVRAFLNARDTALPA